MIMDILTFLGIFTTGWICCQFYFTYKIRKVLQKVAEENGMTLDEMVDSYMEKGVNVIKVPNYFTESLENSILLYNKDTGDFVSQANSMEELADNVYKFNKIQFATVKHNNKHIWFVEGKVQNDLKSIE